MARKSKSNGIKPKVGLIVTMSQDTTWPQDTVDYVESCLPKARKTLNKMGMDVIDCGKIARTNAQMTKQGGQLRQKGIEVLVIYVGCWTYCNTGVSAAVEADVPVVVWSDATLGRIGIVGASITRGPPG